MYLLFAAALLSATALAGSKFEGTVSRHFSLPNQPAKGERALPQAIRLGELHRASDQALMPSLSSKSELVKRDAYVPFRNEQMTIAIPGSRRAKANLENGVYYSKPAGASYIGWGTDGFGYGACILTVAPFVEYSFIDQSNPKADKWTLGGQDITEYVEDGVFTNFMNPGSGMISLPTITSNAGSFTLGEESRYFADYGSAIYNWGEFWPIGFQDDHVGAYLWGAYDNDNLLGTGSVTFSDGTYDCIGVYQHLPKPATPLYCEAAEVYFSSISGTVGTIYMTIYNADDPSEDAEPVYTLVATDEDIAWTNKGTRNGVEITRGNIQFKNIIEEDGFETQAPFVLDFPADVYFTWEEGADFNIGALEIQPEDYIDYSYVDENGETQYYEATPLINVNGSVGSFSYNSPLATNINFFAYQDMVYVPTSLQDNQGNVYEDVNIVKISNDGKTAENALEGWVCVNIAGTDLENYEIEFADESAEEWLTCYYDSTGLSVNNAFFLTFEATELPNDVSSRSTNVVVKGLGVQNETPIIVYQGENVGMNNLILKDATAKQGTQTDVAVWMQNESNITDFQYDLVLPEGFSLAMNNNGSYLCELSSRATNSHSLACAQQEDGSYRFFCYSSSNSLFSGNDGELMSFTVIVPDNASVGEHELQLKNGKMSERDGTKHISADSYSVLNVLKNQIPITDISLSQKTVTLIKGETMALMAEITPTDATNKTLNWSSSNKSVATVSGDGIITTKAEGTATITVKTTDGSNLSASCRITVMSSGYTDINQLNNVLYSTETSAYPGKQVDVQINMKNTNAITSWQADLILPEGFSIAQDSYGDPAIWISGARTTSSKHSVSSSILDDGSIRLLCTSNTNKTFSGTEGEVATMTLNVADNVAPQDYPIIFSNISLVETTSESHWISRITSKLNVDSYTLGDVNNDGDINSIDLVGIVTFILETPIEGNIREAADLNHDNLINNVDYVSEVNVILGITTLNQLLTAAMPTEFARLVVDPFSIIQGKTMTINVQLDASDLYCSAQFDMVLPSGLRIVDCGSFAVTHSLSYNLLEDGSYRFLLTSNRNDFLPTEVGILKITIEADKDLSLGVHQIVLEDIYLVKANTNYVNPDAENIYISVENTNCIDSVNDEKTIEKIYNIFGQKTEIESNTITKKGSQMINGELIIVK